MVCEDGSGWRGLGSNTRKRHWPRGVGVRGPDPGATIDDLVGDMIEMLTNMCARIHERRAARNRAMRALAAERERGDVA